MNHDRLESRRRIVAISAGSAVNIAMACSRGLLGSSNSGRTRVPFRGGWPASAVGPPTSKRAHVGSDIILTRPGKIDSDLVLDDDLRASGHPSGLRPGRPGLDGAG